MLGQVQDLGSGPLHGSQRSTGKGTSQSPSPGCFQRPHGGGPPTLFPSGMDLPLGVARGSALGLPSRVPALMTRLPGPAAAVCFGLSDIVKEKQ